MINIDQVNSVAQAMSDTPEYSHKISLAELKSLPKSFTGQIELHFNHRDILSKFIEDEKDLTKLLDASWKAARTYSTIRFYEDKYIFPIALMRDDGETPLEISIKHIGKANGSEIEWCVVYVNTYTKSINTSPTKEIEKFAWMGEWNDFLSELASIALPENWKYHNTVGDSYEYGLLKNYICNTFFRLKKENKIYFAADKSFAVFNSGLVDNRYDDIYVCFEPSSGKSEWRFCGFAAANNRALKKRIIRQFKTLPPTAQYFEKIEDLLFDSSKELYVDCEHILIDNIDRLPLTFLVNELRDNEEAMDLLRQIEHAGGNKREEAYDELSELIETDSRTFRRLRGRLEDAVDIAKRRVKWNFRTAVPSYYPRQDTMSLLLPLCLIDEHDADAALVVEIQDSGKYIGQTVLTMGQAYVNARLICRPDSDWLRSE